MPPLVSVEGAVIVCRRSVVVENVDSHIVDVETIHVRIAVSIDAQVVIAIGWHGECDLMLLACGILVIFLLEQFGGHSSRVGIGSEKHLEFFWILGGIHARKHAVTVSDTSLQGNSW